MSWDFGGAYANTAGKLQEQSLARLAFPVEQETRGANLVRLHQQIEAHPGDVARQEAAARLNNANAAEAEHRVAAEQKMAEIMRGTKIDDGEVPSVALMKRAGIAMQAGASKTAQELILRASQAQTAEARTAAAQATERKTQTELRIKQAERYAALMSGVQQSSNPQAAFALANETFAREFGEKAPFTQYSPGAVQFLYDSSIKARDRAYIDHLGVTERHSAARIGNTQSYREQILDIRRKAEERRERTQATKEKEGGKDVGAPSGPEVKQARTLLESQGKLKGLDPATQDRAAADVAARAKALHKGNPGLDAGEAQTRALVQMTSEGFFSQEAATGIGADIHRWTGGRAGSGPKTTYSRPGVSATKPLPVPKDGKFVEGMFYQTPKGPAQRLPGGKWLIGAPAATGRSAAPPIDDDEDDE